MDEPFNPTRRPCATTGAPEEWPDAEVRRADPDYRRRVYACVALAIAVAVVSIQWGLPFLEGHLRNQTPEDALASIRLILLVLLLPVFPLGVSLLVTAAKIVLTGSFPAPETRVIRDTPVIRGPVAQRLGILIGVAGMVLAVASIAGAFYIPEMLDQMLASSFA